MPKLMMRLNNNILTFLFFLLLFGTNTYAYGQKVESTPQPKIKVTNIIQVINGLSNEPEGDVRISLIRDSLHHKHSIITRHLDGVAEVTVTIDKRESFEIIILNKHGFETIAHTYQPYSAANDTLRLYINPNPIENPQAIVISSRRKYSSVDNPAHDLAMQVAREELKRRDRQESNYSFRQIDQATISAANIQFVQKMLLKLIPFYPSYLIPSKLDERMILPLSQRERVKKVAYSAEKNVYNEDIVYQNVLGLDQNIDDGTLTVALHELFPAVDLFQRNIHMLDFEIPSPLSDVGRFHYKYYLTDTIVHQKKLAQVLEIIPHYKSVPSFRGKLIISLDSIPHLLQSDLEFPQFSNINFIERMKLLQNYGEVAPNEWKLMDEEMGANIRMFHKIFTANVLHTRKYDRYDFVTPDSALLNSDKRLINSYQVRELKAYADQGGQQQFLTSKEGLKQFLIQLREHPTRRFIMETVDAISTNYIRTNWNRNLIYGGSLFEIGPVDRLVGYDPYNKIRIQLGGRSTALLDSRNFFDGYVAYAIGPRKATYRIAAKHSFIPKRYYAEEFPRHDLSLSYGYELFSPSNRIENEDGNNILYNVGEPHLTHFSYRKLLSTLYHVDINSELTLQFYYRHATDYPAGNLEYVRVLPDQSIIRYEYLRDALVGAELRWSPGERIFPGSMQRENWYERQRQQRPVFSFRYEQADPKLGGQYKRIRTEMSVEQKLWLGAFGRLDYRFNGGKIWNSVPFPLLYNPPLNREFGVRRFSFKALQRNEYVADEWAALFMEYHMRGALANRLPLIKVLKLRGVLTFNMLWGNTTKKNQQAFADELFLLPTIATEMDYKHPYMEFGIGLENILEVLRIDFYRRITPMGPHSDGPWVIKMDLNLNF